MSSNNLFVETLPPGMLPVMEHPPVTITILAFRSKATIRQCLESTLHLVYQGTVDIRVREQAGDSEEYGMLADYANAPKIPNRYLTIGQGANIGFAAGHNELIRTSGAPFVLCLNADAILMPDFLTNALPAFNEPRVGAVQGKIYRWDTAKNDVRRGSSAKPILDTTGLLPLRNRRILNRGQGQEDDGQYDTPGETSFTAGPFEEIFGADGAAPLYRRDALEDVAVPIITANSKSQITNSPHAEYFDESFFAYKEDVDLAWRMQLRGWKTTFVPTAVAWHGRSSGDSAAHTPWDIIAERRKISPLAKYFSFVNQRLMQLKNETREGIQRDLRVWLTKEIAAWSVALLTERKTIAAIRRLKQLAPIALEKRRWIQQHRTPGAYPYRFFQ